jgi:hypothetical protein
MRITVFDFILDGPHFPKSTNSGGFFWIPKRACWNTIILGQDCFLSEPIILAHPGNQAGTLNGNTCFFCKYFMAIQSNQSTPHHIIIMAARPEPADEAMKRAGITLWKERLLIIHTQLLVINSQHICDLDDADISSDVGGICLCRTAQCTACIAKSKLLRYLGLPWCNGGFTILSPEFAMWLHLLMLIDLCTPFANTHCG